MSRGRPQECRMHTLVDVISLAPRALPHTYTPPAHFLERPSSRVGRSHGAQALLAPTCLPIFQALTSLEGAYSATSDVPWRSRWHPAGDGFKSFVASCVGHPMVHALPRPKKTVWAPFGTRFAPWAASRLPKDVSNPVFRSTSKPNGHVSRTCFKHAPQLSVKKHKRA